MTKNIEPDFRTYWCGFTPNELLYLQFGSRSVEGAPKAGCVFQLLGPHIPKESSMLAQCPHLPGSLTTPNETHTKGIESWNPMKTGKFLWAWAIEKVKSISLLCFSLQTLIRRITSRLNTDFRGLAHKKLYSPFWALPYLKLYFWARKIVQGLKHLFCMQPTLVWLPDLHTVPEALSGLTSESTVVLRTTG